MARCPDGHESVSQDYCDVCGRLISGAPASSPAPASGGAAAGSAPAQSGGELCPVCKTPRTPGQLFCEVDGFNFATGAPSQIGLTPPTAPLSSLTTPPPAASPGPAASSASRSVVGVQATWTAVVAADRGYYELMQAASGGDRVEIPFPAYCPERRFQLTGAEMRIGRRSPSRGLEPEIDLTGPPTDPGISRLHAVLIATPDGWAILDPGSANGTQVNGKDIPTSQQVPLRDGDRISLGAWTTITVRST